MNESEYISVKVRSTIHGFNPDSDDIYEAFFAKPKHQFDDWHQALCFEQLQAAIKEHDLAWIRREFDPTEVHPFSFEICCERFKLPVEKVRAALIAKMSQGRVLTRTYTKNSGVDVVDTPGRSYTHPYKSCGKSSLCDQCRERYRSSYGRQKYTDKRVRHRRRAVVGQHAA